MNRLLFLSLMFVFLVGCGAENDVPEQVMEPSAADSDAELVNEEMEEVVEEVAEISSEVLGEVTEAAEGVVEEAQDRKPEWGGSE